MRMVTRVTRRSYRFARCRFPQHHSTQAGTPAIAHSGRSDLNRRPFGLQRQLIGNSIRSAHAWQTRVHALRSADLSLNLFPPFGPRRSKRRIPCRAPLFVQRGAYPAADRLAQPRVCDRTRARAEHPVKGFAKSWAQWRRDMEAERFDAIADQIDSGKALGASNRPAPHPPGDREEVRRPPARSLTLEERVNPTISASLGGVQAVLAGRPSTNCHSDCPVARLRLCPFSHRAWSIGGPAPGVSIRAGPPPVTRGVPPGNVATCAPHFGQDGSLILASLSLARGLQVALPDRGPVRCGTG